MKIDIVHPGYLRVEVGDLERTGLGGNETAMLLAARLLAARVFADCEPADDQGARWLPLRALVERDYRDVVIFWVRTKGSAPGRFNAPVRAVKLGTRKAKDGLLEQVTDGSINLVIALSGFQRDLYVRDHGFPASASWVVTAYGLGIPDACPAATSRADLTRARQSCPPRGLGVLPVPAPGTVGSMTSRKRAAAVIIRDGRLLMVRQRGTGQHPPGVTTARSTGHCQAAASSPARPRNRPSCVKSPRRPGWSP